MDLETLKEKYGEWLVSVTPETYGELLRSVAGERSVAVASVLRSATAKPETRLTNMFNFKILREIHRQETGQATEVDTSGLELWS